MTIKVFDPMQDNEYKIFMDDIYLLTTCDKEVVDRFIFYVEQFGGVYRFGETSERGSKVIYLECYMQIDVPENVE